MFFDGKSIVQKHDAFIQQITNADHIPIAIEFEHIDAQSELESLAETRQAAAVDILGGNGTDRNGQLVDRLRLSRGRNHFDLY